MRRILITVLAAVTLGLVGAVTAALTLNAPASAAGPFVGAPSMQNMAFGPNPWYDFDSQNGGAYRWGQYGSSTDGIAYLAGMIGPMDYVAKHHCMQIVVLPAEMRPEHRVELAAMTATGLGRVEVRPSGSLRYCAQYRPFAGPWLSLDGLSYPIQGASR